MIALKIFALLFGFNIGVAVALYFKPLRDNQDSIVRAPRRFSGAGERL